MDLFRNRRDIVLAALNRKNEPFAVLIFQKWEEKKRMLVVPFKVPLILDRQMPTGAAGGENNGLSSRSSNKFMKNPLTKRVYIYVVVCIVNY